MLTDLSNHCAQTMLHNSHGPFDQSSTNTVFSIYCIPPNEMGSPQTAHLCIRPSQCPNLDPIALTILVIVNTFLTVVALVLVSYLVHILRHALQVEVYSV